VAWEGVYSVVRGSVLCFWIGEVAVGVEAYDVQCVDYLWLLGCVFVVFRQVRWLIGLASASVRIREVLVKHRMSKIVVNSDCSTDENR
jgi:hypothetical protein